MCAMRCLVLHRVALVCIVLQCMSWQARVIKEPCVAVRGSELQCAARCCRLLQHNAACMLAVKGHHPKEEVRAP